MSDEKKRGDSPAGAARMLERLIRDIEKRSGRSAPKALPPLPKDPVALRAQETREVTAVLEARRRTERQRRIEEAFKSGRISKEWTFERLAVDGGNFQAVNECRSFLSEHTGPGPESAGLLIISGMPGSGKSVLANAVAAGWLCARGQRVLIVTPEALERIRYFNSREDWSETERRQRVWDDYQSCDLLVVDGLCADGQGLTVMMQKVLPEILRSRSEKGLSTVLTISLPAPSSLHQAVGDYCFESFKVCPKVTVTALLGSSRRRPLTIGGQTLL
ncbi:MAG: hypothetical protein SPL30_00855 [Succinivibrio sp.]|jgi:DNA replication protein DnaC|nr:hypothetical protein [Succinivibrio sp.]